MTYTYGIVYYRKLWKAKSWANDKKVNEGTLPKHFTEGICSSEVSNRTTNEEKDKTLGSQKTVRTGRVYIECSILSTAVTLLKLMQFKKKERI